MNIRSSSLALLLLLSAAAPWAAEARPRAAAVSPDRYTEFRDKYKAAMKINALPEMARLIKEYNWEVVRIIMQTCELISTRSSDELEEYMAGLNKGWKKAYEDSTFVDKVYEYFSLMEPTVKRERTKLKNKFEEVREQYNENVNGPKEGPKFTVHSSTFEYMAKSFEEIGDWYHASECWITHGACWETANRGKDEADLYKACAAYDKALEARRKLDLKDKRYLEIESIFSIYEKQGYLKEEPADEGSGGTGEAGESDVAEDTAGTVTVPMTFEAVKDITRYERPNYHADEVFGAWATVGLRGKGSTAKLEGIADSPLFHRVGSSDLRLDKAGDGPENDEKIRLTGNFELVEFPLGHGAEERKGAILGVIGNEQSQYQGIESNLAPSDNFFTLYVVAAGSMVGDLAGIPIRVIDDNIDGIYGSYPVTWGHTGISEEHYQPDMDSIVIGASKRAAPWSEYQNVEGQWYRMESVNAGSQIKAVPVTVETGTLKLSFKGGKPGYLVVKGNGRYENSYFDLLQNGSKGIDVPAGRYDLLVGDLRKGKKLQVAKALIIPGKDTPSWSVNPGETTKVELGAPFGFDFKYEVDEDNLSVTGQSVVVTGSAGERYERTWNCVPHPEVGFRKEGTKRGSKPERMTYVQNTNEITELGFRAAWSPLDLIVDRSRTKGDIEVQVTDKKNKLFGKIESDWK